MTLSDDIGHIECLAAQRHKNLLGDPPPPLLENQMS
eukprot:CAMPEP_0173410210 /NCGR_PEP_ID=MMETSP1356-20130122/74085_1 /TAXON_ID=77927 ORGANISM="Hemiselmis virescens, Strain PCC157" /NCGR_SAMPLE_ID=MMETSP1356 /ASSEMBLY_ACC=CAM_ASM_000847 /LENGTH=35 /DNA_ID= /DNA_START= /DNA_END= /DNA_ORIENTATION=